MNFDAIAELIGLLGIGGGIAFIVSLKYEKTLKDRIYEQRQEMRRIEIKSDNEVKRLEKRMDKDRELFKESIDAFKGFVRHSKQLDTKVDMLEESIKGIDKKTDMILDMKN